MKRRYSRVHQILKNAVVIDSSNESDDSDIIENTPVVSPENCSEQAAASTHLKCDRKEIENYTTLTNKYASNEAIDCNAISTTMTCEQVYEVGEISIEAPAFSPLTPKLIHHTEGTPNDIELYLHIVHKEAFEVGETTIEAPANSQLSPKQASQSVIAERSIEGSDFSSLPPENFYVTENSTDNEHASPLSSPMPDMSPATTKIFNILIETEQDSDDSVVDPNYETDSDNSTTDDDSTECDSIHSKIEKKSKNIPVYTPDGWTQIVRLARTNPRPFSVTSLQHDDFKDFGMTNQFHNKPSTSQQKYGTNNAVWLQYRKEVPDTIFMKTRFDKNKSYKEMNLKTRRGKVIPYPVPAYSERFKISSKKKQDLMKLCTDLHIPKMYHSFYANLPYSKTTRDALSEPDAAEDSK